MSLRQSPLHGVHEALGARFTGFAGWEMPVWYEGATAEHLAVRSTAGLFDLSHMAEIEVTGPAAAEALEFALLCPATTMATGRARYSMMIDDQAGIIDDLIVYRLDEQDFLVVANASNGAVVFDELVQRTAALDVSVVNATDQWGLVAVQGPAAEAIVAEVVTADADELRYYRIADRSFGDVRCLVARTGYTGEDGFELYVPAENSAGLWAALLAAGQAAGIVPVGLAARDTLRLEAGMPLYGNELTRQTTPFEVGSARLVGDRPPHSVGAEALAAAATTADSHLVGLLVDGRRPARQGYEVRSAGRVVGQVTSGAASPTLDRPIAIARVSESVVAGTTVQIDVRGTATDAAVVQLPFYKRAS